MTTPNFNLISGVNALSYLRRDSNGNLDGMVSHYLSTESLKMENESERKLKLAKSYEGTYMQGCGFYQDLKEDAQDLMAESDVIKSYLFFQNRFGGYVN